MKQVNNLLALGVCNVRPPEELEGLLSPLEISHWLPGILLSSHFKVKTLYIFLYDCIAEHDLGMT